MIDAACLEVLNVSNIKVEEKGRKAVFKNPERKDHSKIRMDGCVVKNSTSADFVVAKTGVGVIIVELKGAHIEHAADQCDATARHLKSLNYPAKPLAGLIVGTGYPKASASIQKKQDAFYKNHKGPLHVVTKNAEYVFERVLAADGPF